MKLKNSVRNIKAVSTTLIYLSLALVSVCFAGEDIDVEQQLNQLQALSDNKNIKSEVKSQPLEMLYKKSDSKI